MFEKEILTIRKQSYPDVKCLVSSKGEDGDENNTSETLAQKSEHVSFSHDG